ncbi:aminotransferase class IV [Streptomyces sp. NBC_01619]|uniref:Aminotransferase class IV n=1 Tax=Streptomyces pratisoli TaxID=3139917 RepID=A0ACC6QFX0_9ACTN|nr:MULTISPECIES: aminotransferase class IV [unclassified Streptomyces]MCX4509196.1 aminotransferase class IV [Streptomyces sp. NBC_01619]
MTTGPNVYIEIDGRPATELDPELIPVLQSGYGHFTAMQVRDGRARGLALHLERLDASTREMFDAPLDGDHVRALVRRALGMAGRRDASVRIAVYWVPEAAEPTQVVTVREPQTMPEQPRSLMSVPFQRPLAHLKHAGGIGQPYYGRAAVRAGFDDALLTGPNGVISEGSITNVAFWDGTSVVWPDAPALCGITMALLEPLLSSVRREVTLADLGSYAAAFLTNSQGFAPVHRIDSTVFAVDEKLMRRVREAYATVPWDAI